MNPWASSRLKKVAKPTGSDQKNNPGKSEPDQSYHQLWQAKSDVAFRVRDPGVAREQTVDDEHRQQVERNREKEEPAEA